MDGICPIDPQRLSNQYAIFHGLPEIDGHYGMLDTGEFVRVFENERENKCIVCGKKLEWGGFSHNQNMCWECFKAEIALMADRIDQYPSWLWGKRERHKDILTWMTAAIAEIYGLELQNNDKKESRHDYNIKHKTY